MLRIYDIPEPIKSLALKRISEHNEKYEETLVDHPEKLTLSAAFTWSETPEGEFYWRQICHKNYIYPNNNSIQKPIVIIKFKSNLWEKNSV
jgi:hypothetical protein